MPGEQVTLSLEIAVCLQNFANEALCSQGWYAVQIKLIPDQQEAVASVIRVQTLGVPALPVLQAQAKAAAFRSHVFPVRYAHEEDLLETDCVLEFRLLFQDLVKPRSIDLPEQLQLRTVARQRFRLTAVGEGLHAFVPVNFDAEYLVALPTTVHAASLGLSLGLPWPHAELGAGLDLPDWCSISRTGWTDVRELQLQLPRQPAQQSVPVQPARPQAPSKRRAEPEGQQFADLLQLDQLEEEVLTPAGPAPQHVGTSCSLTVAGICQQARAAMAPPSQLPQVQRVLQQRRRSKGGNRLNAISGLLQQSREALDQLVQSLKLEAAADTALKEQQKGVAKGHSSSDWASAGVELAMQRSSDTAALLAEMWACLLWLLVNHGAAVMAALSAGWAEQQAVEYSNWVRPASVLQPAVSDRHTAKLIRANLEEASVSALRLRANSVVRSSPSCLGWPMVRPDSGSDSSGGLRTGATAHQQPGMDTAACPGKNWPSLWSFWNLLRARAQASAEAAQRSHDEGFGTDGGPSGPQAAAGVGALGKLMHTGRGHSILTQQSIQAFRESLAADVLQPHAQRGGSSFQPPRVQDLTLYSNPHQQPLLFVDDSQAPDCQMQPVGEPEGRNCTGLIGSYHPSQTTAVRPVGTHALSVEQVKDSPLSAAAVDICVQADLANLADAGSADGSADLHVHDAEELRLHRQQREAAAPAAAVAAPGGPALQQQVGADTLAGDEVWATPPSTPFRAAASEEQLPAPGGGLPAAEGKLPCGLTGPGDGTGDGSEAAGRGLRRSTTVVGPVALRKSSAERLPPLGTASAPRRASAERLPPPDAGTVAGPAVEAALEASAQSPLSRLSTSAAAPQQQAVVPAKAAAAAAETGSSRATAVGASGNPKRQEQPAMCACSGNCSSPNGVPEQSESAAGRAGVPDGSRKERPEASAAGPEASPPIGLRPGLLSYGKWSPPQPASSHDSPADSQAASRVASVQWQGRASLGSKPGLGLKLAQGHRPPVPPGAHVYVFVHGFQGAATDLRLVRDQLHLMQPGMDFLLCKSNEGRTGDGFESMGARLALEVAEYLQSYTSAAKVEGSTKRLGRITFVGHSIGNLIIRAALSQDAMQPFLQYLWMFLSISGPHLGYLTPSNKLFSSGLWLLKTCSRQGKTLHQLTYTDSPLLKECCLYKLAFQPCLELFKWVVLIASPQDRYVPYDSTRIQRPPAPQPGNPAQHRPGKKIQLHAAMVDRLLQHVGKPHETQLLSVDVDFPIRKWDSLSNVVGRTAHIEFLQSTSYVKFLLRSVLDPRGLL